jgi:DNA-binding SARP family transcriptional activator
MWRARLIDALHEHADRKLQIVIAPAGFGKTTLLADFISDGPLPACWVTLDRADADLSVFLDSIVTAIGGRNDAIAAAMRGVLSAGPGTEQRAATLARVLADAVERNGDDLIFLVLDDFHEVNHSGPVTAFLDELLRVLPDNLRVVLAGRGLPSLTVSRLIVAGELFGLGEADLRFTADELVALLRRTRVPMLSHEQAMDVARGAEGWIAGFMLSIPDLWQGLVGGMIAARGEEGPLYDYLAAEAFDRQPAELQRFLLAASCPDIADRELCEALLGAGDWTAMRDAAEAAGLFITRPREGNGSFRFHQLFRSFLQTRIRRTDPKLFARYHAITGSVLAARGEWRAAITHFQIAGDHASAAALLATIATDLERSGRGRTLVDAIDGLREEALFEHGALVLSATRAAMVLGDLASAERYAGLLARIGARTADQRLTAWAYACTGNVHRVQGRPAEALSLLQQALDCFPADERLVGFAERYIGTCYGMQGKGHEAIDHLEHALRCLNRLGEEHEAALTELGLGTTLYRAARLTEAVARYESALRRWEILGDRGMQAGVLCSLGTTHGDLGDNARAQRYLQEALAALQDGDHAATRGSTHHSLGELMLAAGDTEGARAAFESGLAAVRDAGDLWTITLLYEGLGLAEALARDSRRAEEHLRHAIALAQRQESEYLEARCLASLGAVQLLTDPTLGTVTLHAAQARLEPLGAVREAARVDVWLACAEATRGGSSAAGCHLRAALSRTTRIGGDAVLDLPARWHPAVLLEATVAPDEAARLAAIHARLDRRVRPARPPAPHVLPTIGVRGFGHGAVTVDGKEAAWTWEKSRELFFLLLHDGPHNADQIQAILWPEVPPVRAKVSLHTAAYRLRRQIHRDIIMRRDGAYRLNVEMVLYYDIREFERLTADGGPSLDDDHIERLEQAAALYTAPFLNDLDAAWIMQERVRLEQRLALTLERLAMALQERGRVRESVEPLRRLLAFDPLREDTHARLIRAYIRLGERGMARRQIEQCTDLLRRELGVEPGAELQALSRRMSR